MLTDAAIEGKIDRLLGLKENVIIGKLIPAATGLRRYRQIEIGPTDPVTPAGGHPARYAAAPGARGDRQRRRLAHLRERSRRRTGTRGRRRRRRGSRARLLARGLTLPRRARSSRINDRSRVKPGFDRSAHSGVAAVSARARATALPTGLERCGAGLAAFLGAVERLVGTLEEIGGAVVGPDLGDAGGDP